MLLGGRWQGSRGWGRFHRLRERGYFAASNLEASGQVPVLRPGAHRGSDREQLRMGWRWPPRGQGPTLCWTCVECARLLLGAALESKPCAPFTEGWGGYAPGGALRLQAQPGRWDSSHCHKEGQTTRGWGCRGQWGQGPRGPEMGACLPL